MNYLPLYLIIIVAVCKAIQDTLQFHYGTSVFRDMKSNWWNPVYSWHNKDEWFPGSKVMTWLISNPFVFITDAWHTFGLLRIMVTVLAVVLYTVHFNWYYDAVILWLVHSIVFHITFTYILTIKTK